MATSVMTRSGQSKQTMKFRTRDLTYIALSAASIAVCSWISISLYVPFTLQTLAIFLCVGLLGGQRGTLAIVVYLLLGAVGLPVFAGFTSGIGVLLGNTGGFFLGFVFIGLIVWVLEHLAGNSLPVLCIGMILGEIVLCACGVLWFMAFYAPDTTAATWNLAFHWYVLPFIPMDILKLVLAMLLTVRLRRYVK